MRIFSTFRMYTGNQSTSELLRRLSPPPPPFSFSLIAAVIGRVLVSGVFSMSVRDGWVPILYSSTVLEYSYCATYVTYLVAYVVAQMYGYVTGQYGTAPVPEPISEM